jgi:phospholipase C
MIGMRSILAVMCVVVPFLGGSPGWGANPPDPFESVEHIIVIYQENWSFDGLYGKFPGADGVAQAISSGAIRQVDKYGLPLASLPKTSTDRHVPGGLPVRPYDLSPYVSPQDTSLDLVHAFYTEQLQIDNGRVDASHGSMDKFVAWSSNGSLVMSYYDATNLPEGQLAQQYTLCDHFFHAAFGGSFLNHQFLVAAAAPRWSGPQIPRGFRSHYDPAKKKLTDACLTFDGAHVVNTIQPARAPHRMLARSAELLPPLNNVDPAQPDYEPNIGNRLDDAGVSWKWYSGGWDNAVAGHAGLFFQYHHQPMAYFAKYAPYQADGTLNPATTGPRAHLQDEKHFFGDLATGQLPAVCFIKAYGLENEHPGYAALLPGQKHAAELVRAVQQTPAWAHALIIITYDEHGGRWDHVPPPRRDEWGPGSRVPAIVVSPYTRHGGVDHTPYDTLAILKTIEERFHLKPLNERDRGATSLAHLLHPAGD